MFHQLDTMYTVTQMPKHMQSITQPNFCVVFHGSLLPALNTLLEIKYMMLH
jgi:hypothetical protein